MITDLPLGNKKNFY